MSDLSTELTVVGTTHIDIECAAVTVTDVVASTYGEPLQRKANPPCWNGIHVGEFTKALSVFDTGSNVRKRAPSHNGHHLVNPCACIDPALRHTGPPGGRVYKLRVREVMMEITGYLTAPR